MDYTIDVWTILDNHCAACDCTKWHITSKDRAALWTAVQIHRQYHADNGDSTEII